VTTPLAQAQELPPDWCARLRRRLLCRPDHRVDEADEGAAASAAASAPAAASAAARATAVPVALQAAAVLVPIVQRQPAPSLLLTVRASHLRHHAGQISFPGGRVEAGDADVVAAALRETAEELGIAASFIEPLGFLPDRAVRTGFRVTPVVALLQPHFTLKLDSTEVAEAFELPLAFAMAAVNYRARRRKLRDIEMEVWELPYGEHVIWGATARILAQLRDLLDEA
jgi:8-oxo-dGTP pyrophosphatase MutT (NUDIX family)